MSVTTSIVLKKEILSSIEITDKIDELSKKFKFQPVVNTKVYLDYKDTMQEKSFGATKIMTYKKQRVYKNGVHDINKFVLTQDKQITMQPKSIKVCKKYMWPIENDWIIALTLNAEVSNPLEFKSKLQLFKEQFQLDEVNDQFIDFVAYELETNKEDVDDNIPDMSELIGSDNSDYQEELFKLAQTIFRDRHIIEQFRFKSGFKRLVPNTVELSRPIYSKMVLPDIDNYYITDKIDGKRSLLVISEYMNGTKVVGTIVKSISDKVTIVKQMGKTTSPKIISTLLDAEMISKDEFHVFDVVQYRNKRLNLSPFHERFEFFTKANQLVSKLNIGKTKEFVKLDKADYKNQIKEFYSKKREYEIDGLIFTPMGKRFDKEDRRAINTNYNNTISYKWKPLDQLTIDFYLMKIKKGTYVLCSGVDKITFNKLRMKFFDGYIAPESANSFNYFPIQFEPSSGDFDYVWKSSNEELDGMVGEFRFYKNGKKLDKPELIKIREDRIPDVKRGEYYGNALRYSELIWHSIKYPLTLEGLLDPPSGYFSVMSDDWYFAQRAFNSYVKSYAAQSYLLECIDKDAKMIDFMAGKGQDIARHIDIGFNELYAVDKDVDALYELLDRKYNLKIKTKEATGLIRIKQADLSVDQPELATACAGVLHFGIHYLCNDSKSLENMFKLASKYITHRLAITCLDGARVFDLLQGQDEWTQFENDRLKYLIKKNYASPELTNVGQEILVKLPFSDEPYPEYLVNIKFLEQVADKYGFALKVQKSFQDMLPSFKRENKLTYQQLTEADKNWCGLYSLVVFEKK